ncbi:GNAT family N-acetyltransferase [Kitasatospora sp. NPDC050543]|uniref:GNAT family N-acetyltransferase n=1 Tax=Kitasatospora sp. NPDC050543 TaxID=3364054 RepID=UPI0037B4E827
MVLHTGPAPADGGRTIEDIDLDAIREPRSAHWRALVPEASDEVAAWADLYLEPALGIAQIEDLMTVEAHLRRGHADAVLATALRRAVDADCGTRFLTADDWPRHWYERRGFAVIGRSHGFERT